MVEERIMNQPILLIPLDERPANTRYPRMLGEIAGQSVLLPPEEIRGKGRAAADLDAVEQWMLRTVSEGASSAVVSCDFLAYGNLINARISGESAAKAVGRLGILAGVNAACPVHAFSVITRVANADDCVEEPLYWKEWGTRLYRWAYLTHRRQADVLDAGDERERQGLDARIPQSLRVDWLARRLRNHTVNLAILDMAARGQIASLALTSDDTAPFGLSSRERNWLLSWRSLIGAPLPDCVHAYPGADEVGSALVARVINGAAGRAPRVWIDYAIAGDEQVVARYEDRPVQQTVLGQIAACGCVVAGAPQDSDFVLGVVTPSPRQSDYLPQFLEEDRASRTQGYRAFLQRLAQFQAGGQPVALADVAYPNGADPLFAQLLLDPASPLSCGDLAAYGAWNTAGNTLGVVVAQAALAVYAQTDRQRASQRAFLAHRFLEDWGYQTVVRRLARSRAAQLWGESEPDPEKSEQQREITAFIEEKLRDILRQLQAAGVGVALQIAAGSARLPWRRLFEVDFDLIAG